MVRTVKSSKTHYLFIQNNGTVMNPNALKLHTLENEKTPENFSRVYAL